MRIQDYTIAMCKACNIDMERVYYAPELQIFKPFVSSDFNGKPIEVTSPNHREALCREHGATLDKTSNLKPPKRNSLEEIGFDKWAQTMKEHGHTLK